MRGYYFEIRCLFLLQLYWMVLGSQKGNRHSLQRVHTQNLSAISQQVHEQTRPAWHMSILFFLMRRKFFTIKIVAIYSRLLVEFEWFFASWHTLNSMLSRHGCLLEKNEVVAIHLRAPSHIARADHGNLRHTQSMPAVLRTHLIFCSGHAMTLLLFLYYVK